MASVQHRLTTGLFPASFDPITNGHLDIVHRALRMCDHLVLGVAVNLAKQGTFTIEERIDLIEHSVGDDPRISVTAFESLTVDFAVEAHADMIIRGVRAMSDFEYEFEMALMNKHLAPELETVFLMSSQQYLYVSSSRLKELVRFGRDVSEFVPPTVAKRIGLACDPSGFCLLKQQLPDNQRPGGFGKGARVVFTRRFGRSCRSTVGTRSEQGQKYKPYRRLHECHRSVCEA